MDNSETRKHVSENEIIIVSGLPRSGTSLMMQMLQNGGIEVVTDQVRTADPDNPRGYLEYEAVKNIRHDASWLPQTRGKAFKMISLLLYHLPPTETLSHLIYGARSRRSGEIPGSNAAATPETSRAACGNA
jgi:hypothetical protein